MTEPILSEEDLLTLIEQLPWTEAKWARGTRARHEYVMAWDVDSGQFRTFAAHIREHGYKARWGRYSTSYLEIGEWTYWALQTCLNREHRSVPTLRTPASRAEAEAQLQLRLEDQ